MFPLFHFFFEMCVIPLFSPFVAYLAVFYYSQKFAKPNSSMNSMPILTQMGYFNLDTGHLSYSCQ